MSFFKIAEDEAKELEILRRPIRDHLGPNATVIVSVSIVAFGFLAGLFVFFLYKRVKPSQ